MNFFEEKTPDAVSLSELRGMVTELFKLRKEADEIDKTLTEKNKVVEELKQKVLSILESNNQTSFPVDGVGTVYTSSKLSVSMPKDPEKAESLRQYFYKNGMADYLTVNHQSLNSIYKGLVEDAQAKGTSIADVLPELGEPKVYVTIGMRKGK